MSSFSFPNQAGGHSFEAFSLFRAWRPRALIKLSHQLLCSSYGRKEEEARTPLVVANYSQSVPRITAESDTEFYTFLVQMKMLKPKEGSDMVINLGGRARNTPTVFLNRFRS